MKEVDEKTVKHLANLSKFAFTEKETEVKIKELNGMLRYFEALDKLDVSGVEPTLNILPTLNVFRADSARTEPFGRDGLLSNAAKVEDGAFVVPKVVG